MISKIKNIVFGLKQWELILLIILLNFLNNYLFSVISNLFDISLNKGFNDHYTIKEKIVLFVIAAPLIETLLFQYAVIEIFKSIKVKLKYCCFLSAFIFGSFHLYNIFYFLYAFVGGLLFAFLYLRGKNQKNAILLPLVTHIIYNGLVFISKYYFA
ncbi:CPBP family intramembrane glutamic endopeptidase [Flavobacterium tistrianum]|uniref:CPBP family intramembrane glutamic endopeptidase n=1 Tax=Flavobacterium tistrianum TaxID=1685414 RepID=UPI000DACD296|nr:CPBP family intramembrane glutamic endopeptidase [Flavobacterium tistrianum]KAF2343002.1 CPBP family intramembrane metalloprotease [Flavobacterium tistrianum]